MRPGPRNLITDIPGLGVGNAEDHAAWSGTTVLLPQSPVVASCDIRGGGPGVRETALLDPENTVERIDALVLSGGSAFGLAAADGVMQGLARRGRGFELRGFRVPIVPAAILFDLANGGDKGWAEPPFRALGLAALDVAGPDFALGNAGAGLGAKAGTLKGGLGSASAFDAAGRGVGALVAVNSMGGVVMPGSRAFWAWPFEIDGEFGGARPDGYLGPPPADLPAHLMPADSAPSNTTIAIVATNLALTKAECRRLAVMAQDGLARAIRPVHTPLDGDVVFAVATGERPLSGMGELALVGAMAADCLARAVARGVYAATGLGRYPGYRQWCQEGNVS